MPAPPPQEPAPGEAVPLYRVTTRGDVAALAAAAVLLAGAVWLLLAPPPVGVGLVATVLLGLSALAFLQALSASTPLGKLLVTAVAAAVGAGAGFAAWVVQPSGLAAAPPPGVAVALLGAAAAVGAMELLRAQGAASYVELARRAITLGQQPETHLAALKFFIPWGFVGIAVLALAELGPEIAGKYAAIFIQYFFNPVGKEVAVACGISSCPPLIPGPPLHPLQVGPFLIFIDAVTALFLAWNYHYLLRVPFLGHFLRWVEHHGRRTVAKRMWIRRLAFFGVLFYAAGPFEGTGAIGGTIVGRTIGLDSKRTWLAVTSGSVLRTTIITLAIVAGFHAFDFLIGQTRDVQLATLAAGIVLLAAAVALVWRRRRAARLRQAGSAEGK